MQKKNDCKRKHSRQIAKKAAVDALNAHRDWNRKKETEIDKIFQSFPRFQKLFLFSAQFQLDSKHILTSASKRKGFKLNTNIS